MELEDLKKKIDEHLENIHSKYPFCTFGDPEYTRTSRKDKVYHVYIEAKIGLPEEFLSKYGLVEITPWIGFDLDLDYWVDIKIESTLASVFNRFEAFLRNLKLAYDQYRRPIPGVI